MFFRVCVCCVVALVARSARRGVTAKEDRGSGEQEAMHSMRVFALEWTGGFGLFVVPLRCSQDRTCTC